MEIKIKNNQRKILINEKSIKHLAKETLKIKGFQKVELSILFVGKTRMRSLNKAFRGIDRTTDVLAFCMREGEFLGGDSEVLGDVVICPEVARRYAKDYNSNVNQEIYLDLIHGILHLLGYDDTDEQGRSFMMDEQRRILEKAGYN